uniref:Uncharacterized protein n=1 Tax=Rhizophora mucronata TaxID=61149 RepID=A0A2P2QEZ6_RHIMU
MDFLASSLTLQFKPANLSFQS